MLEGKAESEFTLSANSTDYHEQWALLYGTALIICGYGRVLLLYEEAVDMQICRYVGDGIMHPSRFRRPPLRRRIFMFASGAVLIAVIVAIFVFSRQSYSFHLHIWTQSQTKPRNQ